MEVMINIIIIIVILIAIFKRMQDVAKKGGDITGQPSAPAHGWPERPESGPEIFEEEEPYPESEQYPKMRPVETPRKSFADKIYRYEEERKESAFTSPETEKSGEYLPVHETMPKKMESAKEFGRRHRESPEFHICPALTACKSELVRGIILSEILGKPIALRRENRW
jgi:hypothetical protein